MIRSSSTRRKNTWLGNSGNWSPRSPRCLGLCSSPASCRARFCCLPAGCGFTKVSGKQQKRARQDRKSTRQLQSPYDLVCRLLLEKKKPPPRLRLQLEELGPEQVDEHFGIDRLVDRELALLQFL